ncbi:DHHC palmitoyltransferase-domain-containing protein [Phakopsora pachyrhizi]|nr:DHHC palmitoyltransferase-domain-containing protein [Phakopsora pachyrhizi]
MSCLKLIVRRLFKCFRRFERFADRWTGRVGPVFISLAVILILISTITYFNVIFPMNFIKPGQSLMITLSSLLLSLYLTCCTIIHYYLACTILPGSPSRPTETIGRIRISDEVTQNFLLRLKNLYNPFHRVHHQSSINSLMESYQNQIVGRCSKCLKAGIKGSDGRGPIKPERTHHCRVCGICQLKYDHHCPWINQCVGLGNERYFVLFLFYLSLSSGWVVLFGWKSLIQSLILDEDWPYLSPRVFVILTWVLSLAMGVTISIMFIWQMVLISRAETSVESSDNDYYRKLLASKGQKFKNPFDLGIYKNIQLFFNVGPGRLPWFTVFLPIPISPPLDGFRWPKRKGWETQLIDPSEELTDDEDDYDY